MNNSDEIAVIDLQKIALKIKSDFFDPVNTFKTTIFLCGGDLLKTNTIRNIVSKSLEDWYGKLYYDIIYPEDIFEELLYLSKSKDLLSLENMLAESVDVIVIIPESPGSIAELGAFTNNSKLLNKIVCIVDKKYKKKQSFINLGPIKLVKNYDKQNLIFIEPTFFAKDFHKLKTALRKIKSNSTKIEDKILLLQLPNFILPAIFLLEPVSKEVLIKIVQIANEDELENSNSATSVALTSLIKKKLVELTPLGYKLTRLGLEEFLNLKKSHVKIVTSEKTIALDNMRLEVLNLQYRKKKLRV